jgi:putative isomerase
MFFDRLIAQDRLYTIQTPASFIPLWTGVPVDAALAREMIQRYLLDPKRFWGRYPFPVVAYNEPTYRAADWWRGPVWVNIAWAMSETLKLHGFEKEHRQAVERLVRMISRNLKIAELYNSATGESDGCWGYGWTCSLFMQMVKKLDGEV